MLLGYKSNIREKKGKVVSYMDADRTQLFKALIIKNFNESDAISTKKTGKTIESFIARGLAHSGICFSALLESEAEVFKELVLKMLSEVKRIAGEKETALTCLELLELACRNKLPVIRNRMLDSLSRILPGDHGLIKYIDMKISELESFLDTELSIARGEWEAGVIQQKKEEPPVTYNISGNPQIAHGSPNVTQIMYNNELRDLVPLLDDLLTKIQTSSLSEHNKMDTRETVEIIKEEIQKPGTSLKVIRKLWSTLPEGIRVLDVATQVWGIIEKIGLQMPNS